MALRTYHLQEVLNGKRKADVLNDAPTGSEVSTGSRDSLLDGATSRAAGAQVLYHTTLQKLPFMQKFPFMQEFPFMQKFPFMQGVQF